MPRRRRPDPHDCAGRGRRLDELAAGDWTTLTAPDLAYTLEGLGVSPDDFERILRHAAAIDGSDTPAALADASDGYRIGAAPLAEVTRFSGRPIGVYARCAVLVWPKLESDFRRTRRPRPD